MTCSLRRCLRPSRMYLSARPARWRPSPPSRWTTWPHTRAFPTSRASTTPFIFRRNFKHRDSKKDILVSDRATLFNLLIGLNGYTICSGVISESLNGPNIVAVPLLVDDAMQIGYLTHKQVQPGLFGKRYIEICKSTQRNKPWYSFNLYQTHKSRYFTTSASCCILYLSTNTIKFHIERYSTMATLRSRSVTILWAASCVRRLSRPPASSSRRRDHPRAADRCGK